MQAWFDRSGGATVEPIKTVNGLLDWTTYFFNYAPTSFEVPLRPSSAKRSISQTSDGGVALKIFSSSRNVPRTLVCHDMRGGYLDDKYIAGTENNEFYHFYHWNLVDIFIYFSHHLVTIPPPHWVASAHLHGVAVLGTFITEHAEGREACMKILSSPYDIERAAKNLAKIAYFYNFDGWLVNIENNLPPGLVEGMVRFTETLRDEMKRLTSGKSVVLWYDAVTTEGRLVWQNELNDLNKPFFDVCDGIFLNYTWRPRNLDTSLKNAGERKHDVYVGLDIHGRGMMGNGGFHTREALEVARRYDLSAAIFAPAWTHENFNGEAFVELENFFWNLLAPHLYLKGPKKLPFRTSFCRGVGKRMFHRGAASGGPWWNLSKQQYQPIWSTPEAARAAKSRMYDVVPYAQGLLANMDSVKSGVRSLEAVQPYDEDAFNGGSCLKIVRLDGLFDSDYNRILVCDFDMLYPLVVRYGFKMAPDNRVLVSGHASPAKSADSPPDGGAYDGRAPALLLKLRCLLDPERDGAVLRLAADRTTAAAATSGTTSSDGGSEVTVEPVVDREVNGWDFRAFRLRCERVGYQISEVAFSLGANTAVLLGFFAVEFGRA